MSYNVKISLTLVRNYHTDLTKQQIEIIEKEFSEIFLIRSRYNPVRIINAILYLVKTGCQWNMLPKDFPKWRCVYHHFRTLSDRGIFQKLMKTLTAIRRLQTVDTGKHSIAVADSQSVKWGLMHSEKGIDGGKKIKGIKRHIIVDSQGLPLAVNITKGNVHDSKGIIASLCELYADWKDITKIKADMGYRGSLTKLLPDILDMQLECVKSNLGNSGFCPIQGRWVVERTFSWLDSYRRISRNFEKYLRTAKAMTEIACSMLLLRYL